ncbi:LVIVD repeat-containing protein [Halogranum amylolyticum]|uniref:LVIVD repeat-containing protein n=1 Tax=Halogranum amylolyticum TaxID=660520 RepID=A0A1H8QC96_9EURY|nr:hypothetical protein [Halogranum amylolyticum]SEO51638.1 LVIVD repeat-containing protein [Halogranum amylolyticum]
MRRRDVLRAGFAGVGLSVFGSSPTAAHPGSYRPYGSVAVGGAKEAVVGPDGRYVFVAATDGYAVVDVSVADRPEVVAERRELLSERDGGPLRMIYDVKLDGDRLLVVGPANPLPGALAGILVADVSDPATPETIGFLETNYPIHNCFLDGDYAYLTANDGGENPLVVVDASGERPEEVARWSLPEYDEAWRDVPAWLRSTHDVWVQDGVAYLAQWDAGTWLVDVSDPTAPTHVANFGGVPRPELVDLSEREVQRQGTTPPGNHHYVAADEDATLLGVGRETWARRTDDGGLVGGPGGIDLWDVADPTTPERLATVDPPTADDQTRGGVWTTAHNFEFRDGRLYSSWYRGGVKRHDVSDPSNPEQLTWWRDPSAASFWTARLAVPGETFVASDMGVPRNEGAELYVFPDHAGDQQNPPPLGNETASGGSGVVTASPTPTGHADTGSAASTGSSDVDAPGFGVGVGLAALGVAGWRLATRRRD